MTIMSDNRYVHVFKFNTDLNKNTNNTNIRKEDIELYPGVGPLPEASVASLTTGSVDMSTVRLPCSM
jgi:hypothetical protein